ncbi:MAG: hypothetical protein K2O08_01295 [Clostridia bacterium]|nr:hypothetical protein [Clostridia bacterium]
MDKEKPDHIKRYTLATRDIDFESIVVTGVMIVLLIVWACLTDDKRLMLIPLFFLAVCFIAFISLLFRYTREPKIAIQADSNGIYLYYCGNKEIFIDYKDIVDVSNLGIRNKWGRIVITTAVNEYKSIRTRECKDELFSHIKRLLEADDKEKYLIKITK